MAPKPVSDKFLRGLTESEEAIKRKTASTQRFLLATLCTGIPLIYALLLLLGDKETARVWWDSLKSIEFVLLGALFGPRVIDR